MQKRISLRRPILCRSLAAVGLAAGLSVLPATAAPLAITPQTPVAQAAENACPPTLSRGASGDNVRLLQRRLNWYTEGTGDQPIAVDGSFGEQTERRVKTVQDYGGIETDGVVGPKTWALLEVCYN
jgi:lysozyme